MSRYALRIVLLVAAAVALAVAAATFQKKRAVAIDTVDDIEGQLDALDPATRAAVIARLTRRAAARVRGRK